MRINKLSIKQKQKVKNKKHLPQNKRGQKDIIKTKMNKLENKNRRTDKHI